MPKALTIADMMKKLWNGLNPFESSHHTVYHPLRRSRKVYKFARKRHNAKNVRPKL